MWSPGPKTQIPNPRTLNPAPYTLSAPYTLNPARSADSTLQHTYGIIIARTLNPVQGSGFRALNPEPCPLHLLCTLHPEPLCRFNVAVHAQDSEP